MAIITQSFDFFVDSVGKEKSFAKTITFLSKYLYYDREFLFFALQEFEKNKDYYCCISTNANSEVIGFAALFFHYGFLKPSLIGIVEIFLADEMNRKILKLLLRNLTIHAAQKRCLQINYLGNEKKLQGFFVQSGFSMGSTFLFRRVQMS